MIGRVSARSYVAGSLSDPRAPASFRVCLSVNGTFVVYQSPYRGIKSRRKGSERYAFQHYHLKLGSFLASFYFTICFSSSYCVLPRKILYVLLEHYRVAESKTPICYLLNIIFKIAPLVLLGSTRQDAVHHTDNDPSRPRVKSYISACLAIWPGSVIEVSPPDLHEIFRVGHHENT